VEAEALEAAALEAAAWEVAAWEAAAWEAAAVEAAAVEAGGCRKPCDIVFGHVIVCRPLECNLSIHLFDIFFTGRLV